jgi:hypothetical protein
LNSSSIHAFIALDPRIFAVRPPRRTETREHDALGGPRNVPTPSHRAGGNLRMRRARDWRRERRPERGERHWRRTRVCDESA